MGLNETNQFLKDNLQNILNGDFDDKFSPDQINMMIEMSFIFNHIYLDGFSLVFEYDSIRIKINNILAITGEYREETLISSIRSEDKFKAVISQFLRDKKINDILK